jgi:hypothetical protein
MKQPVCHCLYVLLNHIKQKLTVYREKRSHRLIPTNHVLECKLCDNGTVGRAVAHAFQQTISRDGVAKLAVPVKASLDTPAILISAWMPETSA